MAQPSDQDREDRALDALMAAAFRLADGGKPMTEAEAKRFARNPPELPPEDEAALRSLRDDFVDRLIKQRGPATLPAPCAGQVPDEEIEQAYAAMHRGKEGDELSDEARREIERKRRELLGEPESKPDEECKDGA
jgi:hypothetical protein